MFAGRVKEDNTGHDLGPYRLRPYKQTLYLTLCDQFKQQQNGSTIAKQQDAQFETL